ncbi:ABC transporter permease [Streptomyces sp. JV178]|uniref:carbohydrate ABC transporter permease n=1 Tax=Streptomyces TaxID=1883 RepID=UPI000C1B20B2|nr:MULTISPECIES: sugar ABC transporter permease [Streptomyces]MCL6739052.1 sugar ABC transporter permease [Streptomyces neyagawaensis]MDE1687995.1 sugar ABC transporter permease [Streptomyces neyagawaensis]PIM70211.1 ABC transporter permease [Streptomyces sp. JV178]
MKTVEPAHTAPSGRDRAPDLTTAPAPPARPARRGREWLHGLLMSAPAVAGLIAFVGVPFCYAVVLSFYNVRLGSPLEPTFFGVEQYRRLFTDPDLSGPFLRALLNNLTFAVVVVPLQTGLALGLAILLNRKLKAIGLFRSFFFMPVVFPMALVAVIWRLILARSEQGMLNSALDAVSFGNWGAFDWLGDGLTAMASVIVLSVWQGVGFQMVILLAGLQQIPDERYEAAQLDRASRWQQFRHVTLPGIRGTLVFVALLTSVLSFRVFDQVYVLVKGGGLDEDAARTVMYQAVTTAFDQNNIGQASAITVVFFLIVVVLTLIQRRIVRPDNED